MANPDNFNPLVPIPNGPIPDIPEIWTFKPAGGNAGGPPAFIMGNGFTVSGSPFVVSISQVPPPIIGTVTKVTADTGLVSLPVTGVRVSGSFALAPAPSTLTPGAYKYANLTVDQYGHLDAASTGNQPLLAGLGIFPISVTGAPPLLTVSIGAGSTSQQGAVELVDDLISPDSTKALTANQGYILNNDINSIPIAPVNNQYYAGSFNPTTGRLQSVSSLGSANGYTVGQTLPSPGSLSVEGFVIATGTASYNPPGGGGPYNVQPGDEFYCGNTSWLYIPKAFRYSYATDTTAGIVQLAKQSDVRPFTNNTLVCTPYSLANLIATNTEVGWILLSTDAECRALLTPSKAVTPANLSATPATLFDRGIVQLNNSTTSTSTTEAATVQAINAVYNAAILKSQIVGVGDLISASAPAIPQTVSRGTNKYALTADDQAVGGMAWEIISPPQTCPVGTIFWFPSNDPLKLPTDWAYCDGATASSAAEISPGVANPYYDLFQVVGYTYGGSGATFHLPDMRGKFVRGWSGAGGTSGAIDAPRTFGSTQLSSVITHTHQFTGLGHDHNPISIVDPGHNHSARTATVIGPNRGYFGNKDTGPDLMSDGTDVTGVTMVLADFDPAVSSTSPSTVYKQTLTNTAPIPTDETKPVNFPLVPIIRYTYGLTPPIPNPNPYFYYVSVSPTSMGASATATVTVLTANVARGTTLYWELGGPGVDASLFNPATLTGSVTIGYNNVATFSVTSAASLPTPPYSVEIKIYSDSARLNQVGNTAYLSLT